MHRPNVRLSGVDALTAVMLVRKAARADGRDEDWIDGLVKRMITAKDFRALVAVASEYFDVS